MIVLISYPRIELELSLNAMILFAGFAFRALDYPDKVLRHLFAVNDQPAFKKPVPRVLTV